MPDVAVQEPEVQVVEEETPAAPIANVAETLSPEGDDVDEAAETRLELIRELFKGAKADELRAALDEVPPEIRGELEAEIERKGEQRAQTRQREVSDAKTVRKSGLEPLAQARQGAQTWLSQQIGKAKAGDFDALNPDQLIGAIDAYYNGGIAHVSLENEQALDKAIDTYLPNLTESELKELDKPLYEFGRTGEVAKALPKIVELAIERAKADAFAEGVKKGEQSKQAKSALAERLAKISEIKKQAPGVSPRGRSQTAGDRRTSLMNEIEAIDPYDPSAQSQLNELKKRMKAQ